MEQLSPNQHVDKQWRLPGEEKVERAVDYFWSRPLKPAQFVIIFKLHNLSKRKIRLLLEALVAVTNLVAAMLQAWKEDVAHPREDCAIAEIFGVQQRGVFGRFRARALSAIMEKQFSSIVAATKQQIHGRLITGACRDAAQMIVGWAERISAMILDSESKGTKLDSSSFRKGWARIVEAYQRAIQLVIFLDYNPDFPPKDKDEKLVRKAKREARWKLDHLRPLDEIERILAAIEELLEEMPSTQREDAMYAALPWNRPAKHQRSVRQSWFFQRVLISANEKQILGELERGELIAIRDEMQEMKLFLERAQDMLGDTHDLLEEQSENSQDHDVAGMAEQDTSSKQPANERDWQQKLMRVRSALETFLYRKPASFPSVEPVQHSEELITLLTAVDYRKLNRRKRPRLITRAIRGRLMGSLPLHLLIDQKALSIDEQPLSTAEHQYHRRMRWFQLSVYP